MLRCNHCPKTRKVSVLRVNKASAVSARRVGVTRVNLGYSYDETVLVNCDWNKDENILVEAGTGRVTLIDFGSGCEVAGLGAECRQWAGTPVLTPPEWIHHRSYTPGSAF